MIKEANDKANANKIDAGKCATKAMVTKNPCSHPGDIRVLQTVSLEEFRKRIKTLFNPDKQGGDFEAIL